MTLGAIDLGRGVTTVGVPPHQLVVRIASAQVAETMVALLTTADGLDGLVPHVVATSDGARGVDLPGDSTLLVLTYVPGNPLPEPDVPTMRSVGTILGRLHTLSAPIAAARPPSGRDLAAPGWASAIQAYLVSRAPSDLLSQWAIRVHPRILPIYAGLSKVIGHGDLTSGNFAWDHGQVRLFDFGGVYVGSRLLDIGNAISNLAGRRGRVQRGLAQALLDGYASVSPLSRLEYDLLPVVILLDLARIITWLNQHGRARLGRARTAIELAYREELAHGLLLKFDHGSTPCTDVDSPGLRIYPAW